MILVNFLGHFKPQNRTVNSLPFFFSGVISGVLAMPTFPVYFGIQGDTVKIAAMKGDVVSVLQAGCCAGALLVNFPSGN